MENLIRIKLDPRRGGADPFDFLRPCFCLGDWPSAEVEIWSSDDGGQSWDKLADTTYRASYDPEGQDLYVSLLFDITGTTLLAFFGPGGNSVGLGYTVAKYRQVSLGWCVEGTVASGVPLGWSAGSDDLVVVGCGVTIEGELPGNTPIGHRIKWPTLACVPVGCTLASPEDNLVRVGCQIGTVASFSVELGGTILGLAEFSSGFLLLDASTLAALCGEAAQGKQKLVTLNGTEPEELD